MVTVVLLHFFCGGGLQYAAGALIRGPLHFDEWVRESKAKVSETGEFIRYK